MNYRALLLILACCMPVWAQQTVEETICSHDKYGNLKEPCGQIFRHLSILEPKDGDCFRLQDQQLTKIDCPQRLADLIWSTPCELPSHQIVCPDGDNCKLPIKYPVRACPLPDFPLVRRTPVTLEPEAWPPVIYMGGAKGFDLKVWMNDHTSGSGTISGDWSPTTHYDEPMDVPAVKRTPRNDDEPQMPSESNAIGICSQWSHEFKRCMAGTVDTEKLAALRQEWAFEHAQWKQRQKASYSCADKSRILLTDESGQHHCIKFPK